MRTSSRPRSRRLPAVVLSLALTGGSLAAAGVAASPAGAAVPACKTSQLVAWLDTSGNGAAGTVFYALNFTNVGNTCTLRGYPGVSAVSQNGHQLGSAARRQNSVAVKTITLKGTAGGDPTPASTVHATLGIVEAGNFSPSACHGATASGLRVFAPNQASSSFVAYPFAACSSTGPGLLNVTAVKR